MIQWMLAIWSLVPPIFLNPACISEYSWFRHFWSLAWKILNIILLAYEVVSTFFGIAFFEIGMKTDLFHPVATVERVFQICWHIECSTLTETSIRILNSSTRISLPPLALFVVMLPKAHLMSCSRMSDSRWVGYIFPLLLCLQSLVFITQLFVPTPKYLELSLSLLSHTHIQLPGNPWVVLFKNTKNPATFYHFHCCHPDPSQHSVSPGILQ